jgi:hypothetical protein
MFTDWLGWTEYGQITSPSCFHPFLQFHPTASDYLQSLARSKLRWGAVAVTPEYTQGMYIPPGKNVMHLTIASEEDDITDHQPGMLYI